MTPSPSFQSPQPSGRRIGERYEFTASRETHQRLCGACVPGRPCWTVSVWDRAVVELLSWVGYGALGWWIVRPVAPSRWQIAALVGPAKARTVTPKAVATLTLRAHDIEIGRMVDQ